eukprot:571079-Amphidinium_carterae.1
MINAWCLVACWLSGVGSVLMSGRLKPRFVAPLGSLSANGLVVPQAVYIIGRCWLVLAFACILLGALWAMHSPDVRLGMHMLVMLLARSLLSCPLPCSTLNMFTIHTPRHNNTQPDGYTGITNWEVEPDIRL